MVPMTPASGSWVPDGGGGVSWSGDPAEEPTEGADWNDSDYDGLPNWLEDYLGTGLYVSDSDYDGIFDGDEVNVTGTNPTVWDSDGNGVSDFDDYYRGIHGYYPWDQPQPQPQPQPQLFHSLV